MNDAQFAELVLKSDIHNGRNYIDEVVQRNLLGRNLIKYFKKYNRQLTDAIIANNIDKKQLKRHSYLIYDDFKYIVGSPINPYRCCGMSATSNRFSLYFPVIVSVSGPNNIIFDLIESDYTAYVTENNKKNRIPPETFSFNSAMSFISTPLKIQGVLLEPDYKLDLYVENSVRINSKNKTFKYQCIKLIVRYLNGNVCCALEVFWCSDYSMIKSCNDYDVNSRKLSSWDEKYNSDHSQLDFNDLQRTYRSTEPLFSQEAIDYFKYVSSVKFRVDVALGRTTESVFENFKYRVNSHKPERKPEFVNIDANHFHDYVDHQNDQPKSQFYHQLAFKYAIVDNPIFGSKSNTLINNHDYWFTKPFIKFEYEFKRYANYKGEPITTPIFEYHIMSSYRRSHDHYLLHHWKTELKDHPELYHDEILKRYYKGVYIPQRIPAPDMYLENKKNVLYGIIYKGFINYIDRVIDYIKTEYNY